MNPFLEQEGYKRVMNFVPIYLNVPPPNPSKYKQCPTAPSEPKMI
jgi:hypothetical protein